MMRKHGCQVLDGTLNMMFVGIASCMGKHSLQIGIAFKSGDKLTPVM